jgi:hypothetical protein
MIFVNINVRPAPKKETQIIKHKAPLRLPAERGALLYSIARKVAHGT